MPNGLAADAADFHEVATSVPAFPSSSPARDHARAALASLAFAAGAGGIVSALTLYQAPGVGTALATGTLAAAWLALARVRERAPRRAERWALAALVVLGSLAVVRTSGWLLGYDVLLFGMIALALPSLAGGTGGVWTFGRALRAAGGSLAAAVQGAAPSVATEIDVSAARARLKGPVLGLVLGAPVALLFLLLFVSADPVFAALVEDVFAVPSGGRLLTHGTIAVLVAWALAGLAWRARVHRDDDDMQPPAAAGTRTSDDPSPTDLAPMQWGLGLLLLLFVAFVGVQLAQVVGFADALALPGVTYAGAARQGFFQLLAVTALIVVGVPVAVWLTRRADDARVVRVELTALVVLTVVIACSALLRMSRYTDAYGLTELRFHATAAMLFLIGVLAWMTATVLRGRPERFLTGTFAWLFAGVLALHALNPDAAIASYNVDRDHSVVDVDLYHLASLSDDAIPALVARAADLTPAQRAFVCRNVEQRAELARWRSARWSPLSWSLPLRQAARARCP